MASSDRSGTDDAPDEPSDGTYRAIFEHAHDAIVVFEPETERILDANPRACELYGATREELLRSTLIDFSTDAERGRQEVEYVLAEGMTPSFETVHRRTDGTEVQIEASGVLVEIDDRPAILTILRDISERKQLERELAQAQKMEAVGQLASGIAHDFANLLTAIIGSAGLLRELGELSPRGRECVDDILLSAERGGRLTRDLLSFSHKQITQPTAVNVNRTIETVSRWLSRLIDDSIVIRLDLASNLGAVFIDPVQLEQVLLNLAVNARDAMPDGGTLTIQTANISLDERLVRLSVVDNGIGMDKRVIANAFTPFFTTKTKGKGTGLGLSTVYGIVKQASGKVHIDSTPGVGTTVHVFLPRHDVDMDSIHPPPPDTVMEGHGRVLVVEDDAGVRSTVRRILEAAGYEVTVASDALRGRKTFESRADEFDALVSDIQMPGESGVELTRALRAIRSDLPVVLMSGNANAASLALSGEVEFISKPFKPGDLTAAIKRAMGVRG